MPVLSPMLVAESWIWGLEGMRAQLRTWEGLYGCQTLIPMHVTHNGKR